MQKVKNLEGPCRTLGPGTVENTFRLMRLYKFASAVLMETTLVKSVHSTFPLIFLRVGRHIVPIKSVLD